MQTDPVALIERVPGWAGHARVIGPLDGGITNHNFLIDFDGARYVLRVPGDDTHLLEIDRAVEREANERAAGLGFAPEVVAFIEPEGCLVTRFVEGAPLPRDAMVGRLVLEQIAARLRSFHESGPIAGEFDAFTVPGRHLAAATGRGVPVSADFRAVEGVVRQIAAAFDATPESRCPCHNDLLNANFLRDGNHLWLIDWEYAGMNDRYFDLANLAVNNGFAPSDEEALIDAYFGRITDRRLARLRLMKIVSDARESTWGLVQVGISTIDFDYAGYAQEHLDRLMTNATAPDFRDLLAVAAAPDRESVAE